LNNSFTNSDEEKESARNSMTQFFKPEFLNRLDDVIEFNELDKEDLIKIVNLMLDNTNNMVNDQGLHIDVTEKAKEKLVDDFVELFKKKLKTRWLITSLIIQPARIYSLMLTRIKSQSVIKTKPLK